MTKRIREEDEYIAKEEAAKTLRLKEKLKEQQSQEDREATLDHCYMKCPKCGSDLNELTFRGMKIDRCLLCDGVWLDQGELETLAGTEDQTVISDIIQIITGKI